MRLGRICPRGLAGQIPEEQLKSFRQRMRLQTDLLGLQHLHRFWKLLLQKLGKGDVTLEQHCFVPVWEEIHGKKLIEAGEPVPVHCSEVPIDIRADAEDSDNRSGQGKDGTVTEEENTVGKDQEAGVRREPDDVVMAEAGDHATAGSGHRTFTPAWDEQGKPSVQSEFKVAASSDAVGECPEATTSTHRWPKIWDELWAPVTPETLEATSTSVSQWQQFNSYLNEAGAPVSKMTPCGVGFPYIGKPMDTYTKVENYVAAEHEAAMTEEIRKDKAAGNLVPVSSDWLEPVGEGRAEVEKEVVKVGVVDVW
ncbi:hypothetical protein CYMTET_15564 [Cymbomonas tetramitiformis]|uniref:Uncharacterized protein n=1 Tax=Cymbomonas tetramitiformis TaxID=36881 RepID=A0AAE0GF85_9CHLO|nr:hypothetical protein CYMTET_15564 [Cymbomonas tetramitiformis]